MKKIIGLILILSSAFQLQAQKYSETELRGVLDSLSVKHTGLNNTLQLNVFGLPLHELITSVAMENNLNLIIDPSLEQMISYNFYDAKVKDMLVFLYSNFELEYEFVGSIISIKKRPIQQVKPTLIKEKAINITYNPLNEFLSMDLKNDTLWKVLEKVTLLSGKNFVISPEVRSKTVNAFLQNRPFEEVLNMFVKSNLLSITKEKEGNFTIEAAIQIDQSGSGKTTNQNRNNSSKNSAGNSVGNDFKIVKNGAGNLDVSANNLDLSELLKVAADELNIHYVLYSNLEGKVNLETKNISFDDLLTRIFNATKYNFKKDNDLYVIGETKIEGLRKTELIRLENRTIENVKTAIPRELVGELEISEFVELNGLIVSGSERGVSELKSFLSSIDVVVPMVQIDVILIVSSSGSSIKTGIKAGIKTQPTVTSGTVFPGLDVEAGAATINALLNAISGFGVVNLGKVTENFYVSLQALENNNTVDIESTPKISTLNGHQATISIGETTYYQETQVNVQTTINNQGILQSKVWKSIDANLTVVIKPFVSADEYVTLTIKVDQNDFSGRVDETAPPNTTTQKFESMVRVKNGEVILLGGLEEKSKKQSGSGVPLLSRIPVLKWIFGNRLKERSKSKLHLLIKPTVTY